MDATALAVTRATLLAAHAALRQQHRYLVTESHTVSEDDFWQTHAHVVADEHARMGARARTHVLNAFSLKQMKQQTLQVYDALLGTHLAEPT